MGGDSASSGTRSGIEPMFSGGSSGTTGAFGYGVVQPSPWPSAIAQAGQQLGAGFAGSPTPNFIQPTVSNPALQFPEPQYTGQIPTEQPDLLEILQRILATSGRVY